MKNQKSERRPPFRPFSCWMKTAKSPLIFRHGKNPSAPEHTGQLGGALDFRRPPPGSEESAGGPDRPRRGPRGGRLDSSHDKSRPDIGFLICEPFPESGTRSEYVNTIN